MVAFLSVCTRHAVTLIDLNATLMLPQLNLFSTSGPEVFPRTHRGGSEDPKRTQRGESEEKKGISEVFPRSLLMKTCIHPRYACRSSQVFSGVVPKNHVFSRKMGRSSQVRRTFVPGFGQHRPIFEITECMLIYLCFIGRCRRSFHVGP
jgi:hypothetical protein